jgi:hypothetical protein
MVQTQITLAHINGKGIVDLTQQVTDVSTLVLALANKVLEFVDNALTDKLMVTYVVTHLLVNAIHQLLQALLLVLREHITLLLLQDVQVVVVTLQLHLRGLAVALGLVLVIVVTSVT